jgi:hypothetical protein
MPNPVCPNCQRPQVVASPQYCPYCNFSFLIAAVPAPVVDPLNPYAEFPPARVQQSPLPANMVPDRGVPDSPLVPNRLLGPRFTTSTMRALGITAGIVALALVAVAILVHNLFNPNHTADQWLSNMLTNSQCYIQPAPSPCGFYSSFMTLMISVVPMAAVMAYWFSLRRLFQEWAVWVWLKTIGLTYGFVVGAVVLLGSLADTRASNDSAATFARGNPLAFMGSFPATLIFLALVALLCSGAGIGFGYFFAQWPIERIRNLRSSVWLDLGLTLGAALGGMLLQYIVYLIAGAAPFATGYWWVPLAAILVAAYACWSALRPVNSSSAFAD